MSPMRVAGWRLVTNVYQCGTRGSDSVTAGRDEAAGGGVGGGAAARRRPPDSQLPLLGSSGISQLTKAASLRVCM